MSPWIKFGCIITGWNSKILANCTESSYKALKKYTSSMLILMILWAFTGYCFADRYVGAPWWGCVIVSIIFVVINSSKIANFLKSFTHKAKSFLCIK